MTNELPSPIKVDLAEDSWVTISHLPKSVALTPAEFEDLWRQRPTFRDELELFGKSTPLPRYQQTYGESYLYPGMKRPAMPMTPVLSRLMEHCRLQVATLNSCLVNWYEGPDQYIGFHSDDETRIVGKEIFSLSFGETRKFCLRPKSGGPIVHTFELHDGMMVVMGGRCQSTHKHAVPKSVSYRGRRINITFRSMGVPEAPKGGVKWVRGDDAITKAKKSEKKMLEHEFCKKKKKIEKNNKKLM